MQPGAAVLSFAAIYAVGIELTNRVSVFYLDFWDPKFHDQAGNIAVFHDVLPIFVSLASLSFLVGLSVHRTWLAHARILPVVVGGGLSGAAASLLPIVDPALQSFESLKVIAGVLGTVSFWLGPACVGAAAFRCLRGYAEGSAV